MKFKLHLLAPNCNAAQALLYDIEANTLTDCATGEPVSLEPVNRSYVDNLKYTPRTPLTPDTPGRKSNAVKYLKIQMGLGCNYSCSYCLQADHRPEDPGTSKRDAEKFLENLSWLEGTPEKIEFWGGEPLLYWHKLCVLVDGLREKFPDTPMSIVTNGSLLDYAKVNFLQFNKVRITISHDGPGQSLRGKDPFDDPEWVEMIRTASKTGLIAFNMVLTKKNLDPVEGVRWIKSRVGEHVIVNVESVVNVHDVGSSAVMTDAELAQIQENLFAGIVSGALDDVPILNWKLANWFNGLMLRQPLAAHGQKCGMDREDYLAVDLLGNVLTCQNVGSESRHKIGTTNKLASARLNTSTSHHSRESCKQCPVVHMCYGACMYLDGVEFEQTCRNEYAANLGVLQAALYFLTKKVLVRIEPLGQVTPRRKHIPIVEVKDGTF